MSSRSMAEIENVVNDVIMFGEVVRRIAKNVAWSDQLMKLIAVLHRDEVYHNFQVTVAEERFLHQQESFRTRKSEHDPSRRGPPGEKEH